MVACRNFGLYAVKLRLDPDEPSRCLGLITAASQEEIVSDLYDQVKRPILAAKAAVSGAAPCWPW